MKIPLHLILIYFLCRIHPRPTMSDEVFCEELDKPKVFTDFLMIDVMELLFLIELICTIFIDLKGKK